MSIRLAARAGWFAVAMLVVDVPARAGTASAAPSVPSTVEAGSAATARSRVIAANPSSYLALLRTLRPGDVLQLAPGRYERADGPPGLPLFDLHGTAEHPIRIEGPPGAERAVLVGRAGYNTVRLRNASHLILRDFDIDSRDLGGDGIKAQGLAHHITLENLTIHGVGPDQSVVGISTNGGTTWNWTIRRVRIIGAGTGMYLGNSDGRQPFICGVIEHNLIVDSIGYNVQIKHQLPRVQEPGMPTATCATRIRHNVFSKANGAAREAAARPNLLVGHFPPNGPGSEDRYEIHGNLFHENPTEALFQGEGNIALYGNVFINRSGSAIHVQPHNGRPRDILIFGNTILARDAGVRLRNARDDSEANEPPAGARQSIVGNAIFAAEPISGPGARDNVVAPLGAAREFLLAPDGDLGGLDLRPRGLALDGPPLEASGWANLDALDRDFDGAVRAWTRRGAYGSSAASMHWPLRLAIKPRAPLRVSGTAAPPARGK